MFVFLNHGTIHKRWASIAGHVLLVRVNVYKSTTRPHTESRFRGRCGDEPHFFHFLITHTQSLTVRKLSKSGVGYSSLVYVCKKNLVDYVGSWTGLYYNETGDGVDICKTL